MNSSCNCNANDAGTVNPNVNLVDGAQNISSSYPSEGSIKLESASSPPPLILDQDVKPSLKREHEFVEDHGWNVHSHAAAAYKVSTIFSVIQSPYINITYLLKEINAIHGESKDNVLDVKDVG